jgi:hypothetical protein
MEIGNNCIQYANNTKYLNECLSKLETVERCYESIDNIMSKREIDDKLFCIVSSRQQYPDVLAKYDERDRKKGNIGPKISIEELLELRDAYIEKCNRNRYLKLPLYREYLKQECNKLYIIKKGT